MSSKSDRNPPARSGKWSISGRLVLHFTVSTSIIMLLSMGLVYLALVRHSNSQDISYIRDRMRVIRADIGDDFPNAAALQKEVEAFDDGSRPPRHWTRILDDNWNVLAETPGMSKTLPPSIFTRPASVRNRAPQTLPYRTEDGHWYLLTAAWVGPPDQFGHGWLIQLGEDRMSQKLFRSTLRTVLLIIFSCAVAVSAFVGYLVARRGLAPVNEMAALMTRMKAPLLHKRVGNRDWPSELTALAAAFDEMLARLEQAFERLSQLSGDLAHEIRTPLSNMRGEAEVALTRSRTAEEYREILESNLEEIQRLSQMTDSLLFLARADNPETRIRCSSLDTRRELSAIAEFHDAAAEERQVTIVVEGTEPVNADPLLFRRAVSNLVSNALRHTSAGGRITLASYKSGDRVEVSVGDTGEGIDSEHLEKIFDRFYRAANSRQSDGAGAGLGLAIVKSIMQLHGGAVSVQTQSGLGSTFVLCFPSLSPSRAAWAESSDR
ncbi:MAG TPA: heavy metal sensor histidine kinase [Chthoniobacterales bacterium]